MVVHKYRNGYNYKPVIIYEFHTKDYTFFTSRPESYGGTVMYNDDKDSLNILYELSNRREAYDLVFDY